jgi:hypothetical protein
MLSRLALFTIALLLSAQTTDPPMFEGEAWNQQTLVTKAAYVYGWFAGFGTAKGLALRKDRKGAQNFEACVKRFSHRKVVEIVEKFLTEHPTVRQKDIGLITLAALTEACRI